MLNARPRTAGSKAVTVETETEQRGFIASLKKLFGINAVEKSRRTLNTDTLSTIFGEHVTNVYGETAIREASNDSSYLSGNPQPVYNDLEHAGDLQTDRSFIYEPAIQPIHYDGKDAHGDFKLQVNRPGGEIIQRNDAPDGRALATGPGVTFNKNGYIPAPMAA